MANLPMPMNPLEAFSKGFHMTDNLMKQLLERKQLAQQNEQFKANKEQLERHFQQTFGLHKAAAGRAAQAAMDAHMIAQQKLHPMDALNQKLQALQDWENQQNGGIPGAGSQVKQPVKEEYPDLAKMFSGQNMLAGEEQNPNQAIQVPEESIQAPNAPAGQGLGVFSPEQLGNMLLQRQQQQPTSPVGKKLLPGGIDPDELRKALTYQAYGVKAPSSRELAYQGPAREAKDMERLKKEDPEAYQNALAIQHEKQQQHADISAIRSRYLKGLKPGDTEIKNPQTGEVEGFRKQTTEKQKEAAKNQVLFNHFAPSIFKVADKLTGPGATATLYNAARTYKTNPESRQLIDDALYSIKAAQNTTISEAARFQAGRTNQTYNRYAETLKSNDIPKKLMKWIVEFEIPGEANKKAGERFIKELNIAEKKANSQIPATYDYYFDPEKQFASQNKQAEEPKAAAEVKTKTLHGHKYQLVNGAWHEVH